MIQDLKNAYHFLVAFLFCLFYRYPAKDLKVIGVTGTDGKTTTSYLIYHILKSNGKKVALMSSIGAIIKDKEYDTGFHFTTPDPSKVQKYLWLAKKAGSEYMILETTSHALHQNRVSFCNFLVGVLTNITFEHLDYHKTYLNYALTKIKLLKKAKIAIYNRDDKSYDIVKSNLKKGNQITSYGLGEDADLNPQNFSFKTNLPGEFNKYNILAAVAVCKSLGIKDQEIRSAVLDFKLPKGREELVYDDSFKVMVDFAHTPNAFEKILISVKPTSGKLIHVFGSAGERDFKKRPEMGRISAKYADVIILTVEDPRSEPLLKINKQIISGIENAEERIKNKTLFQFPNREEAIRKAIEMAKKGDFVLLTGKAHEKSMNYGNGEEPWDEYAALEKALSSQG